MKLYSTKHEAESVELPEAVFRGLPPDNGLYMPENLPILPGSFFATIDKKTLPEIAFTVSKALIGDYITDPELEALLTDAFNFEAPAVKVADNIYSLELFHGPTLAFKDFGARFMARLMSHFLKKDSKKINILVATSGDTGSAVAQGFLGVPNITVTILYPSGKVSTIQEKQLTTIGQNVKALEIDGTFDDCQRMVKEAFLDQDLNAKLHLTSANSINISRLIPQSFYYYYAYAQLKKLKRPIVFCVPSGNFGNLCGGIMAQRMGLPVHHFVAATNANKVVPRYLQTGKFEPKASVKTLANAMDVGNPSNFPRMLDLHKNSWENAKENISGQSYSDARTIAAMKELYQHYRYVACPHSAIGFRGISDYLKEQAEPMIGVFLATAHPAKFKDIVENAIGTEVEIPARLQEIVNQKKTSTLMKSNYSELKKFLLDQYA